MKNENADCVWFEKFKPKLDVEDSNSEYVLKEDCPYAISATCDESWKCAGRDPFPFQSI